MAQHEVDSQRRIAQLPSWRLAAVAALVYVTAYFLLMARNVPAVDNSGRIAFDSAFRMAPSAGRTGLIQTYQVTWLNYLFYPLDKVYYSLAPSEWSLNTMPVE
jgi:hypothetical protein